MSFAEEILQKIEETPVFMNAGSVKLHRIGEEVFELSLDGASFLLSIEAGLELSLQLAEFASQMERKRRRA